MILVSEADIFFTESLRILAERLSQSKIGFPLRLICNNSPPEEVGVFSTEIKKHRNFIKLSISCVDIRKTACYITYRTKASCTGGEMHECKERLL